MKPDHVDGVCDLGGCDELAVQPLKDDEDEIYIEVCLEHAEELTEGFDGDYHEVEHESPHRGPPQERRSHHCGGTVLVFEVDEGEHHVCTDCGYGMLLEDDGDGDSFSVRTA